MAPTKDWKKVKSAVAINAALGNNINSINLLIIHFDPALAIVGCCHICHSTFNPSNLPHFDTDSTICAKL